MNLLQIVPVDQELRAGDRVHIVLEPDDLKLLGPAARRAQWTVTRPVPEPDDPLEAPAVDSHGHIEFGGLFFHDRADARRFAVALLTATETP